MYDCHKEGPDLRTNCRRRAALHYLNYLQYGSWAIQDRAEGRKQEAANLSVAAASEYQLSRAFAVTGAMEWS